MKRRFLIVVIIAVALLVTAFLSYRITMRNIRIEVEGETAYLTVYGQTDIYDMN